MKKEWLKQKLAWKGVRSLEFRVLWWILRGAAVFLFVGYLAASALGAKTWAEVKWVRGQELSRLEALLRKDDFSRLTQWVQFRPLSESRQLIDMMTPYSARLPSFVFIDFTRRADAMGDPKKAEMWSMLAHYRIRYDTMRCGLADGVEMGDKLMKAIALVSPGYERDVPVARRRELALEVLAFDEKYPAANDPADLCRVLSRLARTNFNPLPPDLWESQRLGLREATRIGLDIEENGNPLLRQKKQEKKK